MGFKLDDMIGAYKDFARGYLFYARVTNPAGIEANHPYLVNTTSLPAQTIEALTTSYQGNEYKIGGVQTFTDFTITFKADDAQALRQDFLAWMNLIHDPVSNEHGNPATYFGQVDLSQLGVDGQPIMSYSLVNAFPTSVAEIALSYESKEISTFDVTFAYQYHIIDNIQSGVPATPASV